jgi:Na+/proline symporter/signal transduction histidine kinase
MNFDSLIVLGFLFVILIVGITHGQKIKNIEDYALGGRNFTTTTLVCTIVATWIGGEDFFILVSESYSNGLYFILAYSLGILVVILLIGMFFVPRMSEFLGDLTIAESMGKLFGSKVRVITAIAGCIGTSGMIAAQFKISGMLFEYSFDLPSHYGIIIGALVVTIYSALGGIKSVSFTDVIQLFMFGAILPTLAFFILGTLDSSSSIMSTLATKEDFDYTKVLDFSSSKSLYYLFIFFWVAIPSFDPAIFQRISMAGNVFQARKSFIISAFVFFILSIIMSWIGSIALILYPNTPADEIAKHIIMDYSYSGLKGLTLAGILAMMMSTADSYINSTATLFTHDFCKSVGIKIKNELFASRFIAAILGSFGMILALYSESLLQLIITTKSFYMPVVSVPFIFAILGFRSTATSVLIGMTAGISTVLLWEFFLKGAIIDGVVPAMFANFLFLLSSHYLLKQKGGWIGIKDYSPVIAIRNSRKNSYIKFINFFKNFDINSFFYKNKPKQEILYLYFGTFCIISTYFSIYTISSDIKIRYQDLINFIYPSVFFLATTLISYPLWLGNLKKSILISIIWNISLFYILICVGSLQVIMSDFSGLQLMIFVLNFVVLSILTRWTVALSMIFCGLFFSTLFFTQYYNQDLFANGIDNLQFTIAYFVLLMNAILLAFFKPKQDLQEATDARVDMLETEITHLDHEVLNLSGQVVDLNETVTHYSERVADQSKEIERLGATAQKILNNVNHELRLPVGNVMNFAEMLNEGLGKFNDNQLKMLSDEVYKNSNRLSSMILNMLDLATLDAKKIELDKSTVNLSEMVKDRVNNCRKIYLQGKPIDFILAIDPEILISVDPNYMRQTIDNLVINAINFSEKGTINVSLLRNDKIVEFTISDTGVGIPQSEIYDIFTPFKMGSNTESKAEGRGVGLALCRSSIEAHGGAISAESKNGKGAKFRFALQL